MLIRRSELSVQQLNKEFNKYNIPNCKHFTPELVYDETGLAFTRCKEIQKWLDDCKEHIINWIAIDDMNLLVSQELMKNHFVKTQREEGITKEKADLTISLLKQG